MLGIYLMIVMQTAPALYARRSTGDPPTPQDIGDQAQFCSFAPLYNGMMVVGGLGCGVREHWCEGGGLQRGANKKEERCA